MEIKTETGVATAVESRAIVKKWLPLQAGDTVDIIAPAAGCDPAVIAKIKEFLAVWQLQGNIPDDLLGRDLLCSSSDTIRLAHLQQALLNSKSKAIWCLRGGYGCSRLVTQLYALTPPAQSKIFIGLSDITVLHIFLQQQWHWPTLHAPAIWQAALQTVQPQSLQLLKEVIFGERQTIRFTDLIPLNTAAQQHTSLSSVVVGGNLSLVQTSIGTRWQLNASNKILLLEDVNERGYRVDRMLEHLQQAGIFRGIQAIIFGDFIGGIDPNGSSRVADVLKNFAAQNNFPVLQGRGIGHGEINHTIPLGTKATLMLGDTPTLECATGSA